MNKRAFQGTVEFCPSFTPRPHTRHILFDFDGTLSLIRQGWPEVMLPMFCEMLPKQAGESEESIQQMLLDDIMRLNGKQTIYQMIQFAERVTERGGKAQEPLWYKQEYLRRLNVRIEHRLKGLRNGSIQPEDLLVYGARQMLDLLQKRGLTLHLASGTDHIYVEEEAALLKVAHYFGPRIYGAVDNYQTFSKKIVIQRIIQEHQVTGEEFLAFGDGYVEILNTKEIGGLAVAVASDESHNGSGQLDEWKHRRLKEVGADVVIPDFRDSAALLDCIFSKDGLSPSS